MGVCFWRGCLTSLTASLLVRISILTRTIRDEESLSLLFLEREIENTPFIVKASCEKTSLRKHELLLTGREEFRFGISEREG